ncbi:uncharacterized protein EV154DRAFT_487876 [Mucor mucedo]|uniref:uncharacterized protein n=1 Tax=Mucor mucedo TaxID=29922 RepID=UPI00221E8350|nr:uncharacterized protein EV154DRAFT_487876 [Mucor mucedo]KAI7870063.1 hypothetical protein EV154DRAFT_487876 [Mucor mucedo]
MGTRATYHDPNCDYINFSGNPSNGEFGVIPLSDRLLEEYSMTRPADYIHVNIPITFDYISQLCIPTAHASKSPLSSYQFISKCQGTSRPILPLHTDEEKTYCIQIIENNPAFTQTNNPDIKAITRMWNKDCHDNEMLKVYFKTCSHIKSYHNIRKDFLKFKTTETINSQTIMKVVKVAASETFITPKIIGNMQEQVPTTVNTIASISNLINYSGNHVHNIYHRNIPPQNQPNRPISPVPILSKRRKLDTIVTKRVSRCGCCSRTECKGKGGIKHSPRKQHLDRKSALQKLQEDNGSSPQEIVDLKTLISSTQENLLKDNILLQTDLIS